MKSIKVPTILSSVCDYVIKERWKNWRVNRDWICKSLMGRKGVVAGAFLITMPGTVSHNRKQFSLTQEVCLHHFMMGKKQLSFVFNDVPLVQTRPRVNSAWETTCNSQHSVAVKSEKYDGHDGLTRTPGFQFQSKGTTTGVFFFFYQGSNADALDIRRALSLLSNNSWGSHESDVSVIDNPVQTNGPTTAQQGFHSAQHSLPLPSPECWQFDQQATDPHIHGAAHFQEHHFLKPPYEMQYAKSMDEMLKPL